jgi:hypothetical protein
MRMLAACGFMLLALETPLAATPERQPMVNPAIDSAAFLRFVNEAADHRASRLVSEDEFIRLSRLPGAVILDARSRPKYDLLHVRGAVNLSFPDITLASLATALPDKDAVILIYCNNNFRDAPDPFPAKVPAAALNLSTYTSLYTYGYRNVYELAPLLEVKKTRIPFSPAVR